MPLQSLRVLLVEDDDAAARLVQHALAKSGLEPDVIRATTLHEAYDVLSQGAVDAILLDLSLPDTHGIQTLERMHARASGIPIVVLTGNNDESLAVQSIALGAQDYYYKADVNARSLERAIRYAIERNRSELAIREANDSLEKRVRERTIQLEAANAQLQAQILERQRAEQAARSNQERLNAAIDAADLGIWEWDLESGQIFWGGHHERLFGMSPGEFDGTLVCALRTLHPQDRPILLQAVARAKDTRSELSIEFRVIWPDGSTHWIASRGRMTFDAQGCPRRMMGTVQDISERLKSQEALAQSEEQLRLAIHGAGIGIWSWKIYTDEVTCSQKCKSLFGLTTNDEVTSLGKVVACVHPDDRLAFGQLLERALAHGTEYDNDFRVVWPDGTTRWLTSKATVYRDSRDNAMQLQGISMDITDRYLAAEKLDEARKASEELNRNLVTLDEINQSLMQSRSIEDLAKTITDALVQKFGAFFARLWLKRPGDRCATCALASHCPNKDQCLHLISSSGFYTHIDGGHQRVPLGAFKIGLIAQGRGRTVSNDVINDERVHDHEWAASQGLMSFAGFPLKRGDEIIGVVALFSRRVLAPQVLEVLDLLSHSIATALTNVEQQERLVRASQAKGEFLANMSHELRTPLNGVIATMDLLLQTNLDADQRRCASLAKSSGDMLLSLVNDILDFSKIEAGRLELEKVEFDLHYTVENIAACLASRASGKGLEFLCAVDPAVPRLVMGDPGRLQQILTNLIANAIKFTEKGEVAVLVTKEAESEHDATIRFTVNDTGIGIPADRVDRLFESFSQVDSSTTRKYGGTGLGLAISKRLVSAMGGEIGVSSVFGQGSIFWFAIRLRKHDRGVARFAPLSADIRNVRIMAVDDNEASRLLLSEQLAAWHIDHEIAACGADALSLLRAAREIGRPFAIAIIDREMPVMDGLQLAREIKEDPELAATNLVLLKSDRDTENQETLLRAGFCRSLVKPIRPSQLLDTLLESAFGAGGRSSLKRMPQDPPGSPPPGQMARAAGATILLAEDHEIGQQVASMVLTQAGFKCHIVPNGKQALEAVKAGQCALVLMDCQMPEMDGFQATQAIRRYERDQAIAGAANKHIPIIALTANAVQGDRERCLEAGMDDYISKPLDPARLLQLIDAHLAPKSACNPMEEAPVDVHDESTASEKEPTSSAFDMHALMDRWEHDGQIVTNLLERFCALVPDDIHKLQEAIAIPNANEIQRIAHGLKGAAGYVTAERFRSLAAEMEARARDQQMGDLGLLLSQLDSEFKRCKTQIADHKDTRVD